MAHGEPSSVMGCDACFRNPDIGLQTRVVHGRHQEREAPVSEQRRARMVIRSRVYQ